MKEVVLPAGVLAPGPRRRSWTAGPRSLKNASRLTSTPGAPDSCQDLAQKRQGLPLLKQGAEPGQDIASPGMFRFQANAGGPGADQLDGPRDGPDLLND